MNYLMYLSRNQILQILPLLYKTETSAKRLEVYKIFFHISLLELTLYMTEFSQQSTQFSSCVWFYNKTVKWHENLDDRMTLSFLQFLLGHPLYLAVKAACEIIKNWNFLINGYLGQFYSILKHDQYISFCIWPRDMYKVYSLFTVLVSSVISTPNIFI